MPPRGEDSLPSEMTDARSQNGHTTNNPPIGGSHMNTITSNAVENGENKLSTNNNVSKYPLLEMEQCDYEPSFPMKTSKREPLHSSTNTSTTSSIPYNAIHTNHISMLSPTLTFEPIKITKKSSTTTTKSQPSSSKLSSSPPSIKTTTKKQRKSVTFESIHVRTYRQVLGDHPCCSTGLPLTFSWKHMDEQTLSLEDYETTRSPRRSRHDLRLSDVARRNILAGVSCDVDVHNVHIGATIGTTSSSQTEEEKEEGWLSPIDIKRAERRTYRDRERMKKKAFTNKFFACPNE